MKYENIRREEQETIITIDYYEKSIEVYTTRKIVSEKLRKKLGKADKIYKNSNDEIYATSYKRSLSDKEVNKLLMKTILIGQIGQVKSLEDNQEEENEEE